MVSQAKQKETHDAHAKFREFYPGDRIWVKDLQREHTWWPGSVAERSGPTSYVVVLNDGRVWKRHLDHIRRDTMDSAVDDWDLERLPLDAALDPVRQGTSTTSVPSPQQPPVSLPLSNSAEPGTQVQSENANSSPSAAETMSSPNAPLPEGSLIPLRRSSRVRRAPDRLIETN